MSHAFNVLDARGAVSTADRAAEFARMRHLSHSVAKLWIATREKSGYPMGIVTPQTSAELAAVEVAASSDSPALLVFETGVEEMPPHEARSAREPDHTRTVRGPHLAGAVNHVAERAVKASLVDYGWPYVQNHHFTRHH